MSQLVQIMRSVRSMPPLPNVAHRVLQIVRDSEYSIDNLVGVVRTDPALTARILKLCNSSLYGLNREISTVSDAVAYLGSRNLVKLVLVTCTAGYFKTVKNSQFGSPHELWRHTLACATACQFLAESCGYEQPPTAFTAGIVHNVGKVALSQVDDTVMSQREKLVQGSSLPTDYLELERCVLGMDHATAGGIVTETWNLPVDLRRAVRNHHDPACIRDDDDLTALLHVADVTVLQLGIGVAFADATCDFAPEAIAKLHLTTQDFVAVRNFVQQELERSAELLNLDTLGDR